MYASSSPKRAGSHSHGPGDECSAPVEDSPHRAASALDDRPAGARVTGTLWPHQEEAASKATRAVARGGRTSVVAACGTGKTRIGGAVAARIGSRRRTLVVVPTLELLLQTLVAYREAGDPLGTVVAVCSDPTVAEVQLLDGADDIVVTTTSGVLAAALSGPGPATVLSTYASLPVVAAAHTHHGLAPWDLEVVDEAHRTTGKATGPWKAVHHDAQIPARRRLYMTATPRVATTSGDAVVSMDDTSIFGEVSYRLPFSRAVKMGLLADYRVVVPIITDETVHRIAADPDLALRLGASNIQPSTLAGQIAVLRTMSEYGVRRAISYHHLVADARTWASALPTAAALMPGGPLRLWAGHVSGAQAPHLRRRILDRLADPGDEVAVVSNARVLSEGVDVPAVDAVVFARPRRSAIDTIQAVGRAMRTGGRPDKIATIVIPFPLAAAENPEAALEGSEWEQVWQVLRAIRDHDDRLDDQLRRYRTQLGEGRPFDLVTRESKLPTWLTVTGIEVPDDFARSVLIRAVRSTTASWDEYLGAARAFAEEHGHLDIPLDWITPDGLRGGDWLRRQRVAYTAGTLADDRANLLSELGIVWDQLEDSWLSTYETLCRFHLEHGHFAVPVDLTTSRGVNVLNWTAAQRARRRLDKVPPDRVALLDAIGFPWDAAEDRWMRRYEELREVHRRRGSLLRMRSTTREAIWLEGQRIANRGGRLKEWQIDLITALGIDFTDRRDMAWQNTFEALSAFRAETGHWNVPEDLCTVDGIRVRSWARAQRSNRNKGSLGSEKIALLNKINFPWNPAAERWDTRYAELAAFHTAHGHLNVPRGPLRSWLYQQRKKLREDRLSETDAGRLSAIDPLWHDERASLTSEATRAFYQLTDASWARIEPLLPKRGGTAWLASDHRAVIEAVLWKLGVDAPWDDIALASAAPVTVSGWYQAWVKDGTWRAVIRNAHLQGPARKRAFEVPPPRNGHRAAASDEPAISGHGHQDA